MNDWLIPRWPAPNGVRACVTTRQGGVSRGPYAGFNLALHVGDDAGAVEKNRRFLQRSLQCRPTWLEQVHGAVAVEADPAQVPCADASYTRATGIACVVMTADCLPVLFCDTEGECVAAAHAGWRGLAEGILENTLKVFADPANVLVWLGPAISAAAFEVGEDVRQAFVDRQSAAEAAFVPSAAGRYWADLYALATLRLQAAGVTQVYGGGFCTWTDSRRFYSYRRESTTGRFASLIWRCDGS